MEEIINMSPDGLYTKAIEFKQLNDYNNYYIYMTMAANYDHPEAINCLETDYYAGINQKQDHNITFPFYEQTNNLSYSMNYLANMYQNGYGVEKNYDKAIDLYIRAIEKRNPCAMNNLAFMYEHGNGVKKDYRKAIELYMRAIEKGSKNSLLPLTCLYIHHKSLFNIDDIIDFFLVNKPKNLGIILNGSDAIPYLQENRTMKKENQELKKINKELMDHINLSPGGTEYFEILNEWKNRLQHDGK